MEKAFELVAYGYTVNDDPADFCASLMVAPATKLGKESIENYLSKLDCNNIKDELNCDIPEEVAVVHLKIEEVINCDVVSDGSSGWADGKVIDL